MTPFERFFETEWPKRLEAVLPDASWDRKAAWLLWQAEHREGPTYWYHSESESLIARTSGGPPDPHCVELTEEEYRARLDSDLDMI